jgi:hypothetical protein
MLAGKELFYRNGTTMMAVAVVTAPVFSAGKPLMLWSGDYTFGLSSSCGIKGVTTTSYDVSRDGQKRPYPFRHAVISEDLDDVRSPEELRPPLGIAIVFAVKNVGIGAGIQQHTHYLRVTGQNRRVQAG